MPGTERRACVRATRAALDPSSGHAWLVAGDTSARALRSAGCGRGGTSRGRSAPPAAGASAAGSSSLPIAVVVARVGSPLPDRPGARHETDENEGFPRGGGPNSRPRYRLGRAVRMSLRARRVRSRDGALLCAGIDPRARTVIASQWAVEDDATSTDQGPMPLARRRHIRQRPIESACRASSRRPRTAARAPFYWALNASGE